MCLHALLPTFNRFRAPARIPECQHVFSSLTAHFQLVFNYFQLFLAVFKKKNILSVFIYSLLILSIFDRLYLFSTIFTQIRVLLLVFTYFFNIIFNYFHIISTILDKNLNCFTPSSYSQTGSGRPRVGPGRANSSDLALDPMRAGPGHEKSGPTLALLLVGSGRVGPRANRAWPCPRTVYLLLLTGRIDEVLENFFGSRPSLLLPFDLL